MTYPEMLQSPEWQKKRGQILQRDNYTCQRCGISPSNEIPTAEVVLRYGNCTDRSVLVLYKDITIANGPFNNMNIASIHVCKREMPIKCKTNLQSLHFSREVDYSLIVNFFSGKEKVNYQFRGSTLESSSVNQVSSDSSTEEFLQFVIGRETDWQADVLPIDQEGIYLINRYQKAEFVKSMNLHVHHLCYRKNRSIWNQEDSEYITLCNVCHRLIHEKQQIPYYNENGDAYHCITPCWKCGGTKYLECYKNIDGGVCYGCKGRGYLIEEIL